MRHAMVSDSFKLTSTRDLGRGRKACTSPYARRANATAPAAAAKAESLLLLKEPTSAETVSEAAEDKDDPVLDAELLGSEEEEEEEEEDVEVSEAPLAVLVEFSEDESSSSQLAWSGKSWTPTPPQSLRAKLRAPG